MASFCWDISNQFICTFTGRTTSKLVHGSRIFVTILLQYGSILWKIKKDQHEVNKKQQNLLTLNQTVGINIWLTMDLISTDFLFWLLPGENVMVLEMVKIIIVDNICYRFLVPLLLLLNTKKMFPELWSDMTVKRREFYLTDQRILPRRPSIIQPEIIEHKFRYLSKL